MEKKLYIVGIGPGKPEGMTLEAKRILEESDVLAGYPVYLELIPTELRTERNGMPKQEIRSGMTKETERCRLALAAAAEGHIVSLVCSGDPGVYGMAGLALSLRQEYPEVEIRVIPGVTAALSGAALLGAPLIHDFAVISLSDRLTPWEKIEARLLHAAEADFVIVLYNPESKGRSGYLAKACTLLMTKLSPDRPAALVRKIGREGEEVWTGTLEELKEQPADMFTTVFVGNSTTVLQDSRMITDRGYTKKDARS